MSDDSEDPARRLWQAPPAVNDEDARMVVMAAADAIKRGALAIWTIYDRPTDYPEGFIARCHEVAKGKSGPTDKTLTGGLDDIRHVFYRAGLARIARVPEDEAHIVETWL